MEIMAEISSTPMSNKISHLIYQVEDIIKRYATAYYKEVTNNLPLENAYAYVCVKKYWGGSYGLNVMCKRQFAVANTFQRER